MNNKNSYSVILPTLNEVGHIKSLILDISNIFAKQNIKHQIVVVDDNSTDGTLEEIEKIQNLEIVIHKRTKKRKSLVNSLNEGIEIAKYDKIIWLDADYSHPPELIEKFLNIFNHDKIDLIVGSRFLEDSKRYYDEKNQNPVVIDLMSIFLNRVCKFFLFNDFNDYTSGYICIKKEIIKELTLKGYYGDYFIVLISKLKKLDKKILEIPFIEKERASGESKTTKNKIDLIFKCFFYFFALIKSIKIKYL